MSKSCPNTNTDEWKKLVAELNNNNLLAMRAFNENNGEIPSIDSEIVKRLKMKAHLNRGPEIKTVDKKDEFGEQDFYETEDGKKISRVGSFIRIFSGTKMSGSDFVTEKAERLWADKDKETHKIRNRNGVAENYYEYVERRQKEVKIGAAKGKVLHYAIEMAINPNKAEENQAKIKKIITEFSDEKGNPPFYWNWILNIGKKTDKFGEEHTYFRNIEKIFDNLGINYFKEMDSATDDLYRDRIETEVSVAMPEINMAGTVDMVVEHSDGTFSIVDWKTGNNFAGRPEIEDLFLMKYGDQGTKEITDNFRNRAKIQLAMYAILLKANNPGMKFRDLQIGWIPNEYIIRMRDPNAAVDVASFIPMIEEMMGDKAYLEKNGFDPDMKEKLLEKDKNIFDPQEYSQNKIDPDVETEIAQGIKSPHQILENKLDELRYITTANPDWRTMSKKDRDRATQLTDEITKMMEEGNIVITTDIVNDMNAMERHLGNYSEVNHPLVMSWKAFKNDREHKATMNAEAKIVKFRSLLRPVLKEIDKEFGVVNVLGNKSYDYNKIYGWAFVRAVDEDDTGKSRERLLTAKEEDPELKKRWNDLSPAKKRLLTYINKTFADYFEGPEAFMNQIATETPGGKKLSQLDLYNLRKDNLDKRKYYGGWFFKVPITDEEEILRQGGGSYIKGAFSRKAIKRMLFNYATMFKEREFENWFDDTNAIPVKYLGNEFIDTSQNYTHNIEFMFTKAVSEMERTMQMQDVYSLGISIRNKLDFEKDPANPLQPLYENVVKFLDAKLVHDVQQRSKSTRYLNTKKVRVPMYNIYTGKTENYPISLDRILFALRSWGSMVTMWMRPFRGLGNGLQAVLTTHREALRNDIAKMNFLGIDTNSIDFGQKEMMGAIKDYLADYGPHMMSDVRKSKMYLLAKKTNFFGDNFDYHWMEKDTLSQRNRHMSQNKFYLFYGMPEEMVSLVTMGAMMRTMTNQKTGKSLWDSYERYEILDENGNGTGEYDVRWVGGVRGVSKKGSGKAAVYDEMTELTSREIAHMRKVYERLNGNYRREEALAMEAYSWGKLLMQLKKYYPRLLLNGLHAKRIETDLGYYKEVKDENGNTIMLDKDGNKIPVYEWQARITEGRWRTLAGSLVNLITLGQKFKQYGWRSLSAEQKMNLVEAATVFAQFMVFYGLYLTLFGDADEDDTSKKLWKQYLIDNLTQQYNIADLMRTAKSFTTPVVLGKLVDFTLAGAEMSLAGANYAFGNDDAAFTKDNDLRGWNKFTKGIPILVSYKDISNMLKHDKENNFSWFDWGNGGVRLR